MVTWKMKQIFIYAEKDINKLAFLNREASFHVINSNNLILPNTNTANTNYVIIDTDLAKNDIDTIISTYKKFKSKFFAYTKDTTKENILKLYSLGVDNVISAPIDINDLIKNITNPDNQEVNINDAVKYQNTKKVLLLTDNKINSELLIQTFQNFDFIYTIKPITKTIENDIQKDNYDLILIDCKSIDDNLCNISNAIIKSKLNRYTPIVYITASKDATNNLKKYNNDCVYYCIEKPYSPHILQAEIKKILKIKELQDELRQENDLLENMITNSFNQLIITDSNFTVLGGGNQYIPIAKNEYFFNILRNENITFPEDKIRIFSRNAEKVLKFNLINNDKTFEVIISKVFDDMNLFAKYLIIIEDITEKLLIEEQKETFIATLTHDLKSPIRAEQNVLKQMINGTFGELSETQKTILKEVLNSREYESKMIDNLLTRYHSSATNINLLIENNSYKETIKNLLDDVKYMFENKGQKIKFNYNAQTDYFDFDKTEIKRVLSNLLQNASEYTQKNGEISIEVTETDTNIKTTVEDNGYGINAEDLEHIFDKNVTLAKKYRKVGAGLGLYICKTLITAHNGTISVTSQPNKGSSFTFILPKKH